MSLQTETQTQPETPTLGAETESMANGFLDQVKETGEASLNPTIEGQIPANAEELPISKEVEQPQDTVERPPANGIDERFLLVGFDEEGVKKGQTLGRGYSELLALLERKVPVGRLKSTAITNLENSYNWAMKAVKEETLARYKEAANNA